MQLLVESQASWLREARDLAARAAYVQAQTGQYEQAVVALERARSRALNGALTTKEALRESIPDTDRNALQALIGRVEDLQGEVGRTEPGGARNFPALVADLRGAREALAKRIDAVRVAFPHFMPQGLEFPAIVELVAAVRQPLVYVITTASGSLALVIMAIGPESRSKVHPVWIETFTSGDLEELLQGRDGRGGYIRDSADADPEEFEVTLDAVLPVLADRLMSTLASGLAMLGCQRALLVPTGTLGLLPLHAAVPANLTLGYVPSARALKTVFLDADHVGVLPSFLGVGDPERALEPRLDFARVEAEGVAQLFKRLDRRGDVIPPTEATLARIGQLLVGRTHLHFACHGRFDMARPLESALYLAGEETLSLQGLLSGNLEVSALRLAVLSACQTGLIDYLNVPDEVIGFPAGFIQAGVPAVISSLWRVDDVSTAILLTRFYEHHLADGMDPGLALRAAQLWLREATTAELGLARLYEGIFEASGRRDVEASDSMTYYRTHPDEIPFAHAFYWAAFICTGV